MSPEERARLHQAQRDEDLRGALSTESGRRLLWRIIEEMGEFHTVGLGLDPRFAVALEGRRAVGVSLYQEAQRVDADLHLAMVTEALRAQRDQVLLAREEQAEE